MSKKIRSHGKQTTQITLAEQSLKEPIKLIDWLRSHPLLTNRIRLALPNEVHQFTGHHWPFYNESFFPLPLLLTMQIGDLFLLQQFDRWFVRDGLVPIMWFFKKFPDPGKNKSILYIDVRWRSIVPEKWRQLVRYWEVVTTSRIEDTSSLLFAGLAMQTCIQDFEIKSSFQTAQEYLKKNTEAKKLAFLPARSYHGEATQTFHLEFYKNFMKTFGTDITILDYPDLERMNSYSQIFLINIFSKTLLSEDYMTYQILSNGGYCAGVRTVDSENEIHIRISPYHGYTFYSYEELKEEAQSTLIKQNITEVMNSPMFRRYNWPGYFGFKNKFSQPT